MDPEATLRLIKEYLDEGDYREASYSLGDYWRWRNEGGFQPKNGDKRARRFEVIIEDHKEELYEQMYEDENPSRRRRKKRSNPSTCEVIKRIRVR